MAAKPRMGWILSRLEALPAAFDGGSDDVVRWHLLSVKSRTTSTPPTERIARKGARGGPIRTVRLFGLHAHVARERYRGSRNETRGQIAHYVDISIVHIVGYLSPCGNPDRRIPCFHDTSGPPSPIISTSISRVPREGDCRRWSGRAWRPTSRHHRTHSPYSRPYHPQIVPDSPY